MNNERVARDAKTRFTRCFNMGKLMMEMLQKRENCKIRVHSRAYISGTTGRIDMGSTPVWRELIGLANCVSFGDRRVARAPPVALLLEIERFLTFFTIDVGTRRPREMKR